MLISSHLILLQFCVQIGTEPAEVMRCACPLLPVSTLQLSILSQPSCMNIIYKLTTKYSSGL